MEHKTINDFCPHCGVRIDAATPVDGKSAPPAVGDVTCCAYCGGMSYFDDQLCTQKMSPEEFNKLEPEVREIIVAAQATIKRLNLKPHSPEVRAKA